MPQTGGRVALKRPQQTQWRGVEQCTGTEREQGARLDPRPTEKKTSVLIIPFRAPAELLSALRFMFSSSVLIDLNMTPPHSSVVLGKSGWPVQADLREFLPALHCARSDIIYVPLPTCRNSALSSAKERNLRNVQGTTHPPEVAVI